MKGDENRHYAVTKSDKLSSLPVAESNLMEGADEKGRSEEERRALRASFSSVLPEKISFAPAPDIVARGGQSGKLAAVAHKTHPLHKTPHRRTDGLDTPRLAPVLS